MKTQGDKFDFEFAGAGIDEEDSSDEHSDVLQRTTTLERLKEPRIHSPSELFQIRKKQSEILMRQDIAIAVESIRHENEDMLYILAIQTLIGTSMGISNASLSLPCFEVAFSDDLPSLNFDLFLSFLSISFAISSMMSTYVPIEEGWYIELLGVSSMIVYICLIQIGFSFEIVPLVYASVLFAGIGGGFTYTMLIGAGLKIDPFRTGRSSGILYCCFGVTLVIGPQIASLLLNYVNAVTAYTLMIGTFLIPNLLSLALVSFPEHTNNPPDIQKLVTTEQNIIIVLLYMVAGAVFVFSGHFQSGIIEYHGRSEAESINIWAIFNITNPIPRLGIGIAMDYCTFGVRGFFSIAPRNVCSGVYITLTLGMLLYYFFAQDYEGIYLVVFGYVVFFNNAWPPVAVGVCQYIWGPEAMRMFSSFMFFYAIGSAIASGIMASTSPKSGALALALMAFCTVISTLILRRRYKVNYVDDDTLQAMRRMSAFVR